MEVLKAIGLESKHKVLVIWSAGATAQPADQAKLSEMKDACDQLGCLVSFENKDLVMKAFIQKESLDAVIVGFPKSFEIGDEMVSRLCELLSPGGKLLFVKGNEDAASKLESKFVLNGLQVDSNSEQFLITLKPKVSIGSGFRLKSEFSFLFLWFCISCR